MLAGLLVLSLFSALPLFIDVDDYRPDIELQLSAAIDHDVSIESLTLRTVPGIRLVASGIRISRGSRGAYDDVQVEQIDIYPNLLPLLDDRVEINHIRLHEVLLNQGFIASMSKLGDKQSKQVAAGDDDFAVTVRRLTAGPVTIKLDELTTLGPYHTELSLDDELLPAVIRVEREDGRAQLDMVKVKQGYHLELKADSWTPPLGPALLFDKLDAQGLLDDAGIRITSMKAKAYKGELEGMTSIDWKNKWRIQGTLSGKGVDSEPLLNVFLEQPVISGRFTGGFDYMLQANEADRLGERPYIDGDFMFANGVIYNADLEKATSLLNNDAAKGGTTPFSELSGYLRMKNNTVLVKDLKVKSDVLEANGKIGVDANDNLAGVIEVGVTQTGSLVSVPIKVSGTVEEPNLRPTNEAIAGGAVGTGLLGPGVGTAVGVKVGTFFGNLFGDDEETVQEKPKAKNSTKHAEEPNWSNDDLEED